MTKEELKEMLKQHNFSNYNEFLDLVEAVQQMSPKDKYDLLREEYHQPDVIEN